LSSRDYADQPASAREFTGKQAVLEGDGRAFDEIARERLKEAA
jgi:hypothetical protein